MNRQVLRYCGLPLLCLPLAVLADGFTQRGAHVHGVATLLIAVEDRQLSLIFDSPGMNLVGFESNHPDAEQQALLEATITALEDPANIISLPSAAACELQQANVQVSGISDTSDHGHDHDHHDHDHDHSHGHMDFLASYELICSNAEQLTQLTLPLFENWPGVERLNVAWVLDSGQGAITATAARPDLRLR